MITVKELREIIKGHDDYERVAVKDWALRIECSYKYIWDMRETTNSKY